MAADIRLSQRLSTSLMMTPQLQQAMAQMQNEREAAQAKTTEANARAEEARAKAARHAREGGGHAGHRVPAHGQVQRRGQRRVIPAAAVRAAIPRDVADLMRARFAAAKTRYGLDRGWGSLDLSRFAAPPKPGDQIDLFGPAP